MHRSGLGQRRAKRGAGPNGTIWSARTMEDGREPPAITPLLSPDPGQTSRWSYGTGELALTPRSGAA